MINRLEPEKRTRSIPAHLVGHFTRGDACETPFDATLAQAVAQAFKPGVIASAIDGEPFTSRLKLRDVSYEGPCSLVIVLEKY